MAVDIHHWRMIVEAGVTGRALSAGYPDLLVPKDEIQKAIKGGDGEIHERPDSCELQGYHGFHSPIYDSREVFKAIGLELDVIDREARVGGERVVDLNDNDDSASIAWDEAFIERSPLYLGEYDLVIDPGTSEHCFNIPQALVNLAGAVKVGGVISQALPMAMFNHGYWNVNPVALLDFYELNGFAIERMVIRHKNGIFDPKTQERGMRMKGVPEGSVNIITARRMEKKPFTWPQQGSP